MSNVATYQDACTAWLSTDGVLSWVTTSVYERFAGGGYMSGVKLVRGHTEPNKTKDKEDPSAQDPASLDEREERTRKRKSAPPASRDSSEEPRQRRRSASNHVQNRQTKLERELSSLIEGAGKSTAETEEQIRKRDELEIQDDYNAQAGETQGREIEHLVLVTHGIGQRLGLRYGGALLCLDFLLGPTGLTCRQDGKRQLCPRRQCAAQDAQVRLHGLGRPQGSKL